MNKEKIVALTLIKSEFSKINKFLDAILSNFNNENEMELDNALVRGLAIIRLFKDFDSKFNETAKDLQKQGILKINSE